MTTAIYNTLDIYRCCPEKNPYDASPPIYNLVPYHDIESLDTPQLKQAAFNIVRRTGINVFWSMSDRYPFVIAECDEETTQNEASTFTEYHSPPPLPSIALPDELVSRLT
ncbi:uncharacterized protein PHACADRAFT_252948 [Phanerochaete carnosa HHB-10118-sp]|uniref:Uncharacterized protein n=1 Tax=Phanerochaete carnosa (strain HHB-10118-sp) TaxID=650164 RepID=K5X6M7_PHACS|nr:uncharacterized protein PHACADRAFT_252948 [Phanerochaete carnosa HHB-10118-sp]EKM58532.1 hypothetical protein PHACADRAFT_252948 [Phanerochaete carnosa HHB-10118-sp]